MKRNWAEILQYCEENPVKVLDTWRQQEPQTQHQWLDWTNQQMGSSGDRPRQVDNSLNSWQMSNIPVPIKGPAYLRAVEASSKILALVMFLFYFENRKVSFFPHVIIFCSLTACALEKTCMRTPWESSGLLTKSSKQSKPFLNPCYQL